MTDTLHFYAFEMDLREFERWSGTRHIHDRDLATHSLLTEMFGDGAPRPYRLLAVRDAPRGTIYGYGPLPVDDLRAIEIESRWHLVLPRVETSASAEGVPSEL